MTATSTPFGLQPLRHPSGVIRLVRFKFNKTLTEATPTLRNNQPVAFHTDGRLTTVAAGAVDFVGVFQGVQYVDLATGRPVVSAQWVNGTTVKDLGVDSSWMTIVMDPDVVYRIQANAALAASALGDQIDLGGALNGDATTQQSQCFADVATLAGAGQQGQLRIVGLSQEVDNNDWADAFPIIEVTIARHQLVANKAAV